MLRGRQVVAILDVVPRVQPWISCPISGRAQAARIRAQFWLIWSMGPADPGVAGGLDEESDDDFAYEEVDVLR